MSKDGGFEARIEMYDSELQFLNARAPMLVIFAESATLVKEEQPYSNSSLIDVTPEGILMVASKEHPENAPFPMLVTLDGIEILVREVQFLNE